MKYSLKYQAKLWLNLAKISMKATVKFHSVLSEIKISVQKSCVFCQLERNFHSSKSIPSMEVYNRHKKRAD